MVLTIGKYALLVGIYAFVLVVFRGIIGQLAAESSGESPRRGAGSGRASVSSRPARSAPQPADLPSAEREPAPPREPPEPPPDAEPAVEPEREPAAPRLYVLESGDDNLSAGDSVSLSAAVTIGRSEENSLRLADRFVSSRHALICLRDGRRMLLDRGSTNGTFVNGERVEEEIELQGGDRIAMGNTVFEYRTG